MDYLRCDRYYLMWNYRLKHLRFQRNALTGFLWYAHISVIKALRVMLTGIGLVYRKLYRCPYKNKVTNVNFTESLCSLFAQRILDDPAFKLFFKLFWLLVMRQKRTGLYVYKACRHFKKISGILIILVVKIIDIVHILFKEQRSQYRKYSVCACW